MPPEEIPIELRKEWTRLRALLYEGYDLALCTDDRDSHRWLTDRYVLLDVTGSPAVEALEDGVYKLVQSKGFQPIEGHRNYLDGGIVDYLNNVETGAWWAPVVPSGWSVAEHPGRAMLLACNGAPVLIGESTWTQLHRHYDKPLVQYDVKSGRNLFRVAEPPPAKFAEIGRVVAYVAGIRIPDGQEEIARAIAELTSAQQATTVSACSN